MKSLLVDLVWDYLQAEEELSDHVAGCCECAPGPGLCEDWKRLDETLDRLRGAIQDEVAEARLEREFPERGVKTVDWLAQAMKEKLVMNAHKGGWDRTAVTWLQNRLLEEFEELSEAVADGMIRVSHGYKGPLTRAEGEHLIQVVLYEAADVANFAMMIADVTRQRVERAVKLTELGGLDGDRSSVDGQRPGRTAEH